MQKSSKNTKIDSKDIKKYLSEEASSKEKNKVEKQLLNDSFAKDAFDGFVSMKEDKLDEQAAFNDLKQRLSKRINKEEKHTKVIPIWQSFGIAASIVMVVGLGYYFFNRTANNQAIATSEPKLSELKAEKLPDSSGSNIAILSKPKKITSKTSKTISENKTEIAFEAPTPTVETDEIEDKKIVSEISTPPNQKPIEAIAEEISTSKESTKYKTSLSLNGKITDEAGEPIMGVTIHSKSNKIGTVSDINGTFKLNGLQIGDTLIANSIGYKSKEIIISSDTLGSIKLSEDTSTLAEVVVSSQPNEIRSNLKPSMVVKSMNQEAKPEIGWENFDNFLLNSVRRTGAVSTLDFDETVRLKITVEADGKLSKIKVENSLNEAENEKIITAIEKGPKWLPAIIKGKKVKKEVVREIKIK